MNKWAAAKRALDVPKWAIDSIDHVYIFREGCICKES